MKYQCGRRWLKYVKWCELWEMIIKIFLSMQIVLKRLKGKLVQNKISNGLNGNMNTRNPQRVGQ